MDRKALWILALAMALAAGPALAADVKWYTTPGGTEECGTHMKPGQVCYGRFSGSDLTGSRGTGACVLGSLLRFISNVSDANDHDATLTTYALRAGETAINAGSRVITYPEGTQWRSALTGEESETVGRGVMSIPQAMVPPGLGFVATVPALQVAELQLSCF